MKKTIILLGAALAIWSANHAHAHASDTRPAHGQANCAAAPAGPGQCQASVPPPRANAHAHMPYEPSIYSLLLVAAGLLSLRMRPSAGSEKFSI